MKVRDLHWSLHFLVWTAGVTALGAVLGAIVFPLFGLLSDTDKTPGELMVTGMRILGFYFLIWARASPWWSP